VDPWLTNWHGNVGLGMNLGFGTADRQNFFVNANAQHSYARIRNAAAYNAAYGIVNDVRSDNRMEGSLRTDFDFSKNRRWYLFNQVLGGYDVVRRLDHRWEDAVGVGYKVLQTKNLVLNTEGGAQGQYFDYAHIPAATVWSVRFGENLTWRASDKLSIIQGFSIAPNVTDPADFRIRFSATTSYPLFKRITVSLNLINEYWSERPPGVDNNDLQVQSNINVVF
jgi:putative salt-induced outer membrane protein YdiY